MEKRRVVLFRTVLLFAGLNAALAKEETRYFAVNEKLSLGPPSSGNINSVLWKHDGDMVAEWVKDKIDKTYGGYENRTTMDKTTGELIIKRITAADAGTYTVEINKKDLGLRYMVNVIEKVPKPSVEVQPLSCPSSNDCDLSCVGETEGAEPVEYFWRSDEGKWETKEKTVPINRVRNSREKTFTCKITNPVSEEESGPTNNPFYKEEVVVPSGNGGAIAGGVIGSLIFIVIVIGLGYWKRKDIQRRIRGDGTDNNAAGGVAGTTEGVKLTGTGAKTNEDGAPVAGNGEKSPSVESPNESSPLPANEVP